MIKWFASLNPKRTIGAEVGCDEPILTIVIKEVDYVSSTRYAHLDKEQAEALVRELQRCLA